MRVGFATDVGMHREHNEDCFLVDRARRLYIVADGMGGRQAGHVAGQLAVKIIQREWANASTTGCADVSEAISEAIRIANREIHSWGHTQPRLRGMGTTVVVAVIHEGKLVVGHVGDSRAYLLRDGSMLPLTRDHSLVQGLIDSGRLTPTAARKSQLKRMVTRALGIRPTVCVDVKEIPLQSHDRILLVTDGLTDLLADTEIASILHRYRLGLQKACVALTRKVLTRGAPDNTTAILVRYERWDEFVQMRWLQKRFGALDGSVRYRGYLSLLWSPGLSPQFLKPPLLLCVMWAILVSRSLSKMDPMTEDEGNHAQHRVLIGATASSVATVEGGRSLPQFGNGHHKPCLV